jgi:ketosteroid isomerase-like protein
MGNSQMEQVVDSAIILNVVRRFNELFNLHDLDEVMALMTDDCIFENTYPSPDGARYVGQAATRAAFAEFFRASSHARFQTEEIFAAGDRCVVRWVYQWIDEKHNLGHVRGVDLFRVREGKVAEKLAYVKG